MINLISKFFVILILFTSVFAQAQFGPQLTYHGRILDTNGGTNVPVTGNVTFLMQIMHPDIGTCILYQETQMQNLTAADGNFTLTVNGGSSTLPAPLANPFSDIFITDPTRTINCINGGTAPGSTNSRRLNVFFVPPGGAAYEPLPSQAINYVPLAIEALNTNAVGGFGATSLLRVVEINGFGVPIPYAIPALTRPLYEELDATIKGQSAYYVTSQGTVANFSGSLQGEVTGVQSATVVSRLFNRPLTTVSSTFVGGEVLYYTGTNWIARQGNTGTVESINSANNYLTVTGAPPSNNPNINALITINVGQVANTVAAGNDPRIVNAFQANTPLMGDVTGLVSATVVATVGGRSASAISTSVGDTLAATSALVNGAIVKRDGSGNVTVNTISSTNNSTRNILLYNATNTQYATINAPSALAVSYTLTLPTVLPVSGFVLATDGTGQTSWISPTTGNVTNVSATAPLVSTGGQTPTISIPEATSAVDGYLSALSFLNFTNKVASVTVTAPLTLGGTSQTPQIGLQDSGVSAGTYTKFTVSAKGLVTSATTLLASDIPDLDTSKITTGTFPINRGGTGTNALSSDGFVTVSSGGASLTSTVCSASEVPYFNGTNWVCILASSANSSATLVMRDNNGDFTANNITTVQDMTVQRNLRVQNGMMNYIGITTPIATPSYDIVLPNNAIAPSTGQVLAVASGSSATIITTWVTALTDVLASGAIIVGNASGTATPVYMSGDATLSNTGDLQLIEVGAGVTSGTEYTKVTVDGKGRVTSATQLTNADIVTALGFSPMNSVSSTSPITLTGGASNPVIGFEVSGVVSGAYGSNNSIPNFVVDIFGRITSATLTAYADATNATKGIVQIGNNITVTTGVISITSANVIAAVGELSGDVSGTLDNTVVMTVGGKTAAQISQSVSDTIDATSLNSSGTIVRRDNNGNFTANNITTVQDMTVQRNLRVQNGMANYIGITTPIATPSYDIVLPNNAVTPNVGQVLSVASGTAGTTILTTWINALTDSLAPGYMFVGNASGTAIGVAMTGDATMSDTGNLQLISVGSGITSGTQYTKVTVDGKGRVTSGAQLNNADVTAGLGYEPMNSVSSTSPITLTGGASNPVIGLADSGVIATTYGSNTLIPFFTVDSMGRITSAGSQVYADATSATKGIVQIGDNITVSTGVISITSANVIAALGQLGGDVSGTLDNTIVLTVGGKTAAQISQSVSDTIDATSLNSSGTIVRRDNNGNFTANNITTVQDMTVQRNLRVQNGMTNYIGITTPIATPSYDIILPNNTVAPSFGQVLSVASGSTGTVIATRWINALTDILAPGYMFVGNASGTATGVAMTGDATMSDTGNLQLISVGAGITSGAQYTKVTVDGKGRVTSGAQLNNADVTAGLGYEPMNSVSSTSPITLTGGASNPVIGLAFSGVTSGTYPKVTVDLWGRVTSGTDLNFTDVTTGLGYTPTNLVSAVAPLAITGGASNPILSLLFSGVTSGTYPKVTVDEWGRVTSGSVLNFADVAIGLGYSPVASVSTTSPITLTGTASNPVIGLADSGVVATTYGSNTLIPFFTVDSTGRITSASSQVYADATSGTKGIVQIGDNITVTTGTISITSANVIAALGQLGGDVSGTLDNTVVMTVGGKTAAQISQSVSDTINATSLNSSGTIVRRDANGDFTARNITTVQNMTVQANLRVQNGMANYIGIAAPIASPNYDIILPNNTVAPTVGQVLSVASGSTGTVIATRWINALTDVLAPGYIFVGNASGTATGVAMTGDATISNTGDLQLVSVGAGVTSGTQYTKVTVDGKGRVTSGTQLNSADVTTALGYTPADDAVSGTYMRRANNLSDLTSSATARTNLGLGTFATADTVDLGSASATGIIADARLQDFANVTSGTQYTKLTVDGKGRVTSGAQLDLTDVTTALGYTPMNTVSSTSPITLTGGASNPVIGLAFSGVTSGTYPKVTVDLWGRVTSGTVLDFADVTTGLGYSPVASVSAAAPLVITGAASNPVISLANSGVTAGSYGTNTLIPFFTVDALGRITSAGSQVYADATSGTKGIVQIGDNITVTTGTISITSANVIAAMGTLGGDVSGTLDNTVVVTVGGKTAAQISQSVSDTIAATPNNSSGTIVRRDANGDFTARNITTVQNMTVQANLRVQNGLTNYIGITAPIASPNYDIVLPNNSVAPTVGQVLSVASGSTGTVIATRWIGVLNDLLAPGNIYVGNASGTATSTVMSGDATISDTGVLQLSSIGAGVTSGTQYTKVTVDGKGRVTSGAQLNNADVVAALGYTPADDAVSGTYMRRANNLSDLTSSATARTNLGLGTFATADTVDLGSASATGIIADARLQDFAGVTSGTQYTKLTVDGKGRVTSGAQLNNADVTAALGYTPMNSVSSTAPITLTGGASNPIIGLAFSGVASGTYPKVTVDLFGRVTSGTVLDFADVTTGLGYSPVASVSAAAPLVITGTASNPVISIANSGVIAATYGSNTAVPFFTVDTFGRITSAGSQAYADATSGTKGIVQIGDNITVSTGIISITSANVIAALGGGLAGDVSGTLDNNVVVTVGGKTAAQISQSVSDTINATSLNSSGTIVRRDNNGDFTARNITTVQNMTVQANLRVQNGLTNYIGITAPIASPNYDIVLPNNSVAPTVGQVLSVASGSTGTVIATRWIGVLNDLLAPGNIYVGNASGTATSTVMSGDATISDTGVLQLSSIGAGVTSGTQYTKVTVDGKGRVTSGAQLNSADVIAGLGYTPADDAVSGTYMRRANNLSDLTSSATARTNLGLGTFATADTVDLGSASATGIIADARLQDFAGVTSGTQYTKVTVDGKGRVTSGAQLASFDVTTALGYTPMNSVSSTSPITLTGGASNPIIGLAFSGVTSGTYPKVTVDIFGRVTSGTDLNFADVTTGLGYTPLQFVSATAPIVLSGPASSPTISLANSGVSSGTYGSNTLIPFFTVDSTGRITSASSQVYADATSGTKGIVQIGDNITVSTGTISITSANVIAALGASLSGDVTGSLSATVVSFVGGKTSAQVSQSVSDTIEATALNSSGTIVRRDVNGNFVANNITTVQDMTVQRNLRIQNGLTNSIGIFTPIGTPNYDIILPNNTVVPPAGYALGIASATAAQIQTTWVPMLSGSIASGSFYVGNASGVATAVLMSGDATMSDTGFVTLSSVGAGVTSGAVYTKVTVDGKGRVTSGAQLTTADITSILGFMPGGVVSSTAPITITGPSSAPVIGLANSGVTAGTYGSSFTIPVVTVDAFGRLTTISSQTLRTADASSTGVVSIGSNITVNGAGEISLTNSNITSALGFTPVNRAGDTMTGGLTTPALVVSNTIGLGTVANNASAILDIVSTSKGILIPRMTTVERDAIVSGATQDGLQIYNTSNKSLEYYDAAIPAWKTVATNFSALTSLNGSTSSTQVFSTGSAGTSFGVVTFNGVHTFNFPMAASAGVTQGALSNGQYQSFVDKVTSVSGVAGQILITGTTSSPVVGLANSGVTAATYGTSSTIPVITVDAFGRLTTISSQTLRTADASSTGVVSIGNNITVNGAGQISLTNSNITSALGFTPVNRAGDTMTGLLTTPALVVSNTLGLGTSTVNTSAILDVSSTTKGILIPRMTTVQRDAIVSGATQDGLQIYNTTSKAIEYYDAGIAVWKTLVSNYSAITTLNGSVSSTQFFSTGSAGTSFGVATTNGVHTFNFPMAASAGVTQGALTNTQYQSFVDKVTTVSGVTGHIVITGTTSSPVVGLANSGVTAGTYGTSFTIPIITVDAFGRLTTISSQTLRTADASSTGVVSIGSNITVNGAGQISLTNSNITSALGFTPVNRAGDTMTGLLTTPSLVVTNTIGLGTSTNNASAILDVSSTTKGILIPRMTTVQRDAIVSGATQDGLQIYNTTSKAIEYYDAGISLWKTLVSNYSAVTSLNGSVSSTQFFSTGSAGTSFGVATVNGVHTFNFPMAATAGVTQGALTNTQYQSFVDKVTSVSGIVGQIAITGTTSSPVVGLANSGVTAGTYPKVTVDIYGRVTSGTNLVAADIPNLAGDVTGNIASNTVVTVGGKTSAQISQSVSDTINATSANTASMIVKRDASGGFIAGIISQLQSIYRGSTSGEITVRAPATTSTYTLTLPASAGALGNLLQTDGAGTTSWIDPTAIGANCEAGMTLVVGNSATGHKSFCIDTAANTAANLLDYDAANVSTSAVTACELQQKHLCSLKEVVRAKAQSAAIGGAVDLMTSQYFTKVAGGGLLGPSTEISVVCWTSGGTNARVLKGFNASPSGQYLCCR